MLARCTRISRIIAKVDHAKRRRCAVAVDQFSVVSIEREDNLTNVSSESKNVHTLNSGRTLGDRFDAVTLITKGPNARTLKVIVRQKEHHLEDWKGKTSNASSSTHSAAKANTARIESGLGDG